MDKAEFHENIFIGIELWCVLVYLSILQTLNMYSATMFGEDNENRGITLCAKKMFTAIGRSLLFERRQKGQWRYYWGVVSDIFAASGRNNQEGAAVTALNSLFFFFVISPLRTTLKWLLHPLWCTDALTQQPSSDRYSSVRFIQSLCFVSARMSESQFTEHSVHVIEGLFNYHITDSILFGSYLNLFSILFKGDYPLYI